MAEIWCDVVSETDAPAAGVAVSRAERRRRMQAKRGKLVAGVTALDAGKGVKKSKTSITPASFSRENCVWPPENDDRTDFWELQPLPKFGVASVCGRRRDMEDAVAFHPSFLDMENNQTPGVHYFGVFDGHGCSHVAVRCKDRLHLLVKEELNRKAESMEWKKAMEQSFTRMDKEVMEWNQNAVVGDCRCELHASESYGVGSTAVVAIVTADKIVVANCGDSRAVLCRNGKPVPLSNDHKPDRPDELNRIQSAGGRVLYWQGARVSGVLAMSRAIGDNYLKPYVSCEPEVTVTERTAADDCLILASDGLWDVVSNETACVLARMCLNGKGPATRMKSLPENDTSVFENSDKACSDASLLLTKLALARRSSDNVSVVVVDLRKNRP